VQWVTADLLKGPKVADAVADVDAIVHCATNGRHPADDVNGTRRLIDTALLGGSHVIYVSIVGVDKLPLKYYRYKLGIEGIVERSGLPWSVLRATQFHDLVVQLLRGAGRLPVMTSRPGSAASRSTPPTLRTDCSTSSPLRRGAAHRTSAGPGSRRCRISPSRTCRRPGRSGSWRRSGRPGRWRTDTVPAGT
jgi:hypothetical protein